MKAAPQLIVHSAAGHPLEREGDHVQQAVVPPPVPYVQQQPQVHGVRKLGRVAKTTVRRVERTRQRLRRPIQQLDRLRALARRRSGGGLQMRGQRVGLLERLPAPVLPGVGHGRQHLAETRHAHPRLGRPVRATVKRLQIGRQEYRHRPAAAPRHQLHGVHVDLIQVRPLLAIDLDAHEVLVHQPRDVWILEAFVLHHVTPVTGRVADRQKNGPLVRAGQLERRGVPRMPIHRIACVLQQIRARLVCQAVGHEGKRRVVSCIASPVVGLAWAHTSCAR